MWIEKWPEGMWCSRVLRINDKKIYKEVRTNTIIKWKVGTNIVFLAQNDTDALSKLQSLCRLSLQCGIAGILICIYNSKLGQWVIYREFEVFYCVLCPIASHILNECDGTLNYGFRDSPPAEQSHLSSPTSSLWCDLHPHHPHPHPHPHPHHRHDHDIEKPRLALHTALEGRRRDRFIRHSQHIETWHHHNSGLKEGPFNNIPQMLLGKHSKKKAQKFWFLYFLQFVVCMLRRLKVIDVCNQLALNNRDIWVQRSPLRRTQGRRPTFNSNESGNRKTVMHTWYL